MKNNSSIDAAKVRRILILYTERSNYIGDFSTKADKLRYFKSYFVNARIDGNFMNRGGRGHHNDLLKHNPYLDELTALELEDIDFEKYDVVFCATQREKEFLQFLHDKYLDAIVHDRFGLAVFSISALLLERNDMSQSAFPVCEDLYRQVDFKPGELYLVDEERIWANQWLESKGLRKDERLYIVLDSTSHALKLLTTEVYFEYLKFLLQRAHIKILISDEQCIGKEELYGQHLSEQEMAKVIFAKGLSLREMLCILGSDYTDFLFGPCTGLVHCMSSIYNNYVNKGMRTGNIPVIITYTSLYQPGDTAYNWWGNAPLVTCLLLKERNNETRIYRLDELTEEEKRREDALPSSMYTSAMLIDQTIDVLRARKTRGVEA